MANIVLLLPRHFVVVVVFLCFFTHLLCISWLIWCYIHSWACLFAVLNVYSVSLSYRHIFLAVIIRNSAIELCCDSFLFSLFFFSNKQKFEVRGSRRLQELEIIQFVSERVCQRVTFLGKCTDWFMFGIQIN